MSVVALLLMVFYSQAQAGLDVLPRKKILVLGDSLSAAYKLAEAEGWVSLLQRRFDQRGWPVTVVNASVSGATTAAGLQLLPQALKTHRPDWVLLELGANDGLQGKPITYIRRNLASLIEQSEAAGAQVVLLGIRLPPNLGSRYTEPFFQQYAELAGQFALPYVPFLLEGVAGVPELMMADGLHPTARAQTQVLDNVWQVLAPVLAPTLEAPPPVVAH